MWSVYDMVEEWNKKKILGLHCLNHTVQNKLTKHLVKDYADYSEFLFCNNQN